MARAGHRVRADVRDKLRAAAAAAAEALEARELRGLRIEQLGDRIVIRKRDE